MCLPGRRGKRQLLLETSTTRSPGRYTLLHVQPFPADPQVSSIARNSYERVRTIYSYGVFCYDLYTVAGNQARLVLEQALRERFLPLYGGTVTFVDGKGGEHEVTPRRFGELFDRGNPLVRRGWRLKLRSGRKPIPFNGMLASLLRWAREERLLSGQRDRWQDKFRVMFRNYAAHSEYHREMPDDAAAEIFHLSELINQIWGGPGWHTSPQGGRCARLDRYRHHVRAR